MLSELAHFLYHAPRTLLLKRRLTQAQLYDALIKRADDAGLARWRAALAKDVRGDVLEVGCGTGRMFNYYSADVRLLAVEPETSFIDRAREVAEDSAAAITLRNIAAEDLVDEPTRFDTIVMAAMLCSVPSVSEVLTVMKSLLKPDGELRLIEHVRSDAPVAGFMMDAINPLWLKVNAQGCNLNRRPLESLRDAGFAVTQVEPFKVWCAGLPAFPWQMIRAQHARP